MLDVSGGGVGGIISTELAVGVVRGGGSNVSFDSLLLVPDVVLFTLFVLTLSKGYCNNAAARCDPK